MQSHKCAFLKKADECVGDEHCQFKLTTACYPLGPHICGKRPDINDGGRMMPNNCPKCGNDQNVYQIGYDGTWGRFVLCGLHGMQVCEQPPEKAKYQGGTMQTAYPRMEYLDGGNNVTG